MNEDVSWEDGIDGAHHKDWVIDQVVRTLACYGKVILQFDARNADHGGEGTGHCVDESELILLTVGDEDLLNLLAGLEAYINAEGPDPDDDVSGN